MPTSKLIENAPQTKQFLSALRQVRGEGLKGLGYHYSSIEDLILTEGQIFDTVAELPKGIKKGKLGKCYQNATELILRDDSYRYVEGYAVSNGLIPLMHGWAINDLGHVIDPTWNDGVEYYGIIFPKSTVSAQIIATKVYGMLDDYHNQFPILKDKLDFSKLETFYLTKYYEM